MRSSLRIAAFATTSLVLLVGGRALDMNSGASPEVTLEGTLPAFAGCDAPQEWAAGWKPEFVGADRELATSQICDGVPTHVFVAEYFGVGPGREAVNELNQIVPRRDRRNARESLVAAGPISVLQTEVARSEHPLRVWSWYAVGARSAATGPRTKMLEAWNAMRFRHEVTRAVVIAVDAHDPVRAQQVLTACSERLSRWVAEAS